MARVPEPTEPENMTETTVAGDPVSPVRTQAGQEYETRGQVRLATKRGYVFAPSNKDLPVVTPLGVAYTRENADKILAEATRANVTVAEVKED